MKASTRRKRFLIELSRQKWGYVFVAPQLLLFALFLIYPMIEGVRMSLYKTRYLRSKFVGLDNYIKLFAENTFQKAAVNTIEIVVIGTLLTMLFAIVISVSIFDKKRSYVSFIRCTYYLPTIISAVVMCVVWDWILNPSLGVLPYFARQLGFGDINLLGNKATAMPFIIFIVWQLNIGSSVVLLAANMQGLPADVMEAAEIDGTNRMQRVLHVILPLTSQTITYLFIMNVISIIKVYIVIDMLTGGGPNYATTTLMFLSYNEAFNYNNLGNGASIGVIMFFIVLLLSCTQLKRFKGLSE